MSNMYTQQAGPLLSVHKQPRPANQMNYSPLPQNFRSTAPNSSQQAVAHQVGATNFSTFRQVGKTGTPPGLQSAVNNLQKLRNQSATNLPRLLDNHGALERPVRHREQNVPNTILHSGTQSTPDLQLRAPKRSDYDTSESSRNQAPTGAPSVQGLSMRAPARQGVPAFSVPSTPKPAAVHTQILDNFTTAPVSIPRGIQLASDGYSQPIKAVPDGYIQPRALTVEQLNSGSRIQVSGAQRAPQHQQYAGTPNGVSANNSPPSRQGSQFPSNFQPNRQPSGPGYKLSPSLPRVVQPTSLPQFNFQSPARGVRGNVGRQPPRQPPNVLQQNPRTYNAAYPANTLAPPFMQSQRTPQWNGQTQVQTRQVQDMLLGSQKPSAQQKKAMQSSMQQSIREAQKQITQQNKDLMAQIQEQKKQSSQAQAQAEARIKKERSAVQKHATDQQKALVKQQHDWKKQQEKHDNAIAKEHDTRAKKFTKLQEQLVDAQERSDTKTIKPHTKYIQEHGKNENEILPSKHSQKLNGTSIHGESETKLEATTTENQGPAPTAQTPREEQHNESLLGESENNAPTSNLEAGNANSQGESIDQHYQWFTNQHGQEPTNVALQQPLYQHGQPFTKPGQRTYEQPAPSTLDSLQSRGDPRPESQYYQNPNSGTSGTMIGTSIVGGALVGGGAMIAAHQFAAGSNESEADDNDMELSEGPIENTYDSDQGGLNNGFPEYPGQGPPESFHDVYDPNAYHDVSPGSMPEEYPINDQVQFYQGHPYDMEPQADYSEYHAEDDYEGDFHNHEIENDIGYQQSTNEGDHFEHGQSINGDKEGEDGGEEDSDCCEGCSFNCFGCCCCNSDDNEDSDGDSDCGWCC
ncbi:Nn.00g049000.m01.CDS01 [Neocucurbitaria sp. VM-36]